MRWPRCWAWRAWPPSCTSPGWRRCSNRTRPSASRTAIAARLRDPVNALLFVRLCLAGQGVDGGVVVGRLRPPARVLSSPAIRSPVAGPGLGGGVPPADRGDSVVLTLINNGEVASKDFIRRAGGIALTDAGRKATIAGFERRYGHPRDASDFRLSNQLPADSRSSGSAAEPRAARRDRGVSEFLHEMKRPKAEGR